MLRILLLLPLFLGVALAEDQDQPVNAAPGKEEEEKEEEEEEEERDMPTGEMEELPELIPEQSLPWHDSLVELPLWMNRERREIDSRTRPANQGGGLFPPEVWPLQPGPVLAPLVRDDPAVPVPPPDPSAGKEPVLLGPELMARYFSQPPDGVFLDPQHLIQGRDTGAMESLVQRWLNDQCAFETTVVVFGAGQQLPSDFDPQALRREWFAGSTKALLVLYFHHQPERTLAIFGPEAKASYGESVLRRVVDAAVTEAGRVGGGTEQLERFCYKMSVRLHWLALTHEARLAGLATSETGPDAGNSSFRTLMLACGGAVVMGGLVLAGWAWRRRHRTVAGSGSGPVLLPDWEVIPRLGAPHSGGFSAMISFPPAPSREGKD
jgi:hypothetical protein